MKIQEQLVSSRASTYSGTSACSTVTVHETANTSAGADAQAHANLQANNPRNASWHIQVDDTEAIRSYPDSVRCGHAGADAKDSIAVEIAVNSDGSRAGARANAAEVIAQLLDDNGLDEMNVVGHTYWTGKDCPHFILNEDRWDAFIDDVRAHLNGDAPAKKESAASSGGSSSGGSKPWPEGPLTVVGNHNEWTHKAWVKLLTDVGHKGASNDLTRAMQNWLSGLGYYDGYIDSSFGPLTAKALQRFLADKGVYRGRIDGDRGPMTVKSEVAYLNNQRRYYD